MKTFEDYVILKAHDSGIAGSYESIRNKVNLITPYLICREIGHYRQPRWFISRFRNRPWRCSRCGTWWVAFIYGGMGGSFWTWKFLGSDSTVPHSRVESYSIDELNEEMDRG